MIDLRALKRGFLYVAIASVLGAASMALAALASGGLSDTDGRILVTTLLLTWASSLGLASSAGWNKAPLLAGTGIALAVSAFLIVLVPVWSDRDANVWWQLPASLFVVASAFAYALLLFSRHRAGDGGGVVGTELIALVALLILTAMIVIAITRDDVSSSYAKGFGMVGVVLVAATLLTGLLRRLQPATKPEPETPSALAGHTIAKVEYHGARPVIVLDDGRRLMLDPDNKLD